MRPIVLWVYSDTPPLPHHYFCRMTLNPADRWNQRYAQPEYAYGSLPNVYFQSRLDELTPGTILLPADGEGRNGVYAATRGWDVDSFDISTEGQKKALALAKERNVNIRYHVVTLDTAPFLIQAFDALALVYAHFSPDTRSDYLASLVNLLKVGGYVIFEAFSKENLLYRGKNPGIGGPPDAGSLYSLQEVRSAFEHFSIVELAQVETELHEGLYHNGLGSVIRFFGRKL